MFRVATDGGMAQANHVCCECLALIVELCTDYRKCDLESLTIDQLCRQHVVYSIGNLG